jgi:hypothetical protein
LRTSILVQIQFGDFVEAAVAFGKFKQALATAFDGIYAQFYVLQIRIGIYTAGYLGAFQAILQRISQRTR